MSHRKKRPEPAPVRPISAVRLRYAHRDDASRVLALAPAAALSSTSISVAGPSRHSLLPLLLAALSIGILLLAAAAAPVWRVQYQLGLSSLARSLDRHQLDLAIAGAVTLFGTVAVYLLLAIQH